MQPTTSRDLLERIRAGSEHAASELFERYGRRLAVLIRWKLSPERRSQIEVEDLVQETLLRAYRDLSAFEYRSQGSFFRWLSTIADHVISDAVRYRARAARNGHDTRFRSAGNPHGPEPADSVTPSRVLASDEALQRVYRLLDALPENYRDALVMARIEGLTTAEIADRMGQSREAVALLVFRAAKRLRELMGREEQK